MPRELEDHFNLLSFFSLILFPPIFLLFLLCLFFHFPSLFSFFPSFLSPFFCFHLCSFSLLSFLIPSPSAIPFFPSLFSIFPSFCSPFIFLFFIYLFIYFLVFPLLFFLSSCPSAIPCLYASAEEKLKLKLLAHDIFTLSQARQVSVSNIDTGGSDLMGLTCKECNSIKCFYPWFPSPALSFFHEPSQFFLFFSSAHGFPSLPLLYLSCFSVSLVLLKTFVSLSPSTECDDACLVALVVLSLAI